MSLGSGSGDNGCGGSGECGGSRAARVSVIIPTRDEERLLPGLLDRLAILGGWHEVIVADGGSRDRTREIAQAHSIVTRLVAGRDRHEQLNAALRSATGDIVLLIGADLRPGRGTLARLRATRAPAGCLALRHARRAWIYRWGDAFARLRARWTRGAYLDQAPFFARTKAIAAGGFPAHGTYDTSALGRQLTGRKSFAILPAPVVVSCRAWSTPVRTFARYQGKRLRYLMQGDGREARG